MNEEIPQILALLDQLERSLCCHTFLLVRMFAHSLRSLLVPPLNGNHGLGARLFLADFGVSRPRLRRRLYNLLLS